MAKKASTGKKKAPRFILKPPAPGELQVFIDTGRNTKLPADLRKALDAFLKELDAVAAEAEPEGFLSSCNGKCEKNRICIVQRAASTQLLF